MATPLYTCCQCNTRFKESPKATLPYWLWTGICKQTAKKDIVSKTLGKIHKAKITYCKDCI